MTVAEQAEGGWVGVDDGCPFLSMARWLVRGGGGALPLPSF